MILRFVSRYVMVTFQVVELCTFFKIFNPTIITILTKRALSFAGEKEDLKGIDENKMPVEIEKERPAFFTKNLLMKARTPSGSSSNTTVRPSGLS